ncbi:hypothetical protein ACFQRB_10855 [Halobaculum litoreum]|uniref:Uncharacterized protein n=1 Tax=Halobaculum litoreum TaxID=3031998 RepID=A0ABD5XXT6_9EURY
MTQRHTTDRRERFVRRYDYPDGTVVAADLNAADDDVHVDTVDGSAIVVVDREGGEEEFEFGFPARPQALTSRTAYSRSTSHETHRQTPETEGRRPTPRRDRPRRRRGARPVGR